MWKSSGSSGWWRSSAHLWEWAQPLCGGSSLLLILHRMFFFFFHFSKLWHLGLHGAQFKKAIKSPFHMGPPPVGRDIQVRCDGCRVQARAEIWVVCKLSASQSHSRDIHFQLSLRINFAALQFLTWNIQWIIMKISEVREIRRILNF